MSHDYASPAVEPWMEQFMSGNRRCADGSTIDELRAELRKATDEIDYLKRLKQSSDHWHSESYKRQLTAYDFEYEDKGPKSSTAAFEWQLRQAWLFNIHRQVNSATIRLRQWEREKQSYRIDFVLEPTPDLLAEGWPFGNIGVECKKSGLKLGQPLAQMLNYHDATWRVGGDEIALSYIFLWPLVPQGGFVSSLLYQFHMGSVSLIHGGAGLDFHNGNDHMFSISGPIVDWADVRQDRKAGSR